MAKSLKPRDAKVPVALSQGKMLMRMVKLNSVSVSLILVIVVGTFLISTDVQTYLNQRRQIAEMELSIQQAEQAVEDMQAERDRWQDPVYIRSQARDRLYYVLPGEVSYLVMESDSLDFSDTSKTVGALLAQKRNADEISLEVAAANENWVDSILESVLRSALDKPEGE
ncbi:septum formation initiator family protein [Aquiluna borgnonia]|jgi:cell division protein FtsB|uniref:Septum formation initiator family protein n=1 Tax=Aquiluna borgnonia TaxID=2499157 RepID=A0A7D4U7D5_9MICO|nr:septum formation initiator family protein [Aquiluna borgnonia]QKJ24976.1 septum formation initiator family protein [Aquiluna borgnonia]